jgi:uncharacterized protein YxjI
VSPLKYLVLAALGLGALAIDSGAAEASMTNHTRGWCKLRGPADQSILGSDSATLVWKSNGNLVLEPTDQLVPKIWSSGTASRGMRLCWDDSGGFSIYDLSATKIWSQSGGSVPPPPDPFLPYDYVIEPTLSACTLSSRYTMYAARGPASSGSLRWEPSGPEIKRGKLWTKAGVCPDAAPSVSASGWCIDDPIQVRTIVEDPWASLRWNPGPGWLELVATPGIRTAQSIWQTDGIPTQQAVKVCFHNDGRLAMYNASGQTLWQTPAGASGTTTSYLLGIDGCNLTIKPLDGSPSPWTGANRCPQTRLQLFPPERPSFSFPVTTTDQVLIENGVAQLVFQADGNLVLRSVSGDEVWHSGLSANLGKKLMFQANGDLVIYNASNVAVWSAGQGNLGITTLDLDGCAFALKTPTAGKWSRGGTTCPSDTVTNSWSSSNSGVLTLLRTPQARLVWQGNGSLVLRTTTGATVWSSGTGTSGYRNVFFQDDGNLVIYDGSGSPLWSTDTWQTQAVQRRLRLGDHCTLTLEDMSGHVLWTGNDSCTVVNDSFERADGDSTFGVAMYTHLTAKDNGVAELDSSTGIDTTIFGQSFTLFSATAYQTELDDGSNLETASVTVAGESSPGINVGYSHEFFKNTKRFNVGPVPVFVSASVTGDLGLEASFSDGALQITPTAGLYATVQAGVGGECDLGGASAGVRGTLTILELGLPISLKLTTEGGLPRYSIEGDLTITTLSGSFALYAEAYVGWGPVQVKAEWSYTFFRWTGIDWTKQLFKKTGGF